MSQRAAKSLSADLSTTNGISENDFLFFSKKIYDLTGIHLPYNPKNISLMQNRLSRLLRSYQLKNYSDLKSFFDKPNPKFTNEFVTSLTTNKTHFFREQPHFDFLNKLLKSHRDTRQELRVWCAASSTGQEPYSLAISLLENLTPAQISKSKILATDIDLEVLAKAASGLYTENEMDGLPLHLRNKYFTRAIIKGQAGYQALPELMGLIDFGRFNLVLGQYKFTKSFDLIFCRNVLIYFDPPTVQNVINQLASTLTSGGHLVVGHSESGTSVTKQLVSVQQAVYQKRSP